MRYHTTGNSRPWEVATGYRRTMRNPAPIASDEPPLRWGIIAAPIALVTIYLLGVM